MGLVFGTFSFALTLFAVVFVAAPLLANVRRFKAGRSRVGCLDPSDATRKTVPLASSVTSVFENQGFRA